MSDGLIIGLGIGVTISDIAEGAGAGVDNLLLEDGFNFLLENDSVSVLLLEA